MCGGAFRSPQFYFTAQLRFAKACPHELDARASERDIICRSRNDPAACGFLTRARLTALAGGAIKNLSEHGWPNRGFDTEETQCDEP